MAWPCVKLQGYGVTSNMLNWIRSYLSTCSTSTDKAGRYSYSYSLSLTPRGSTAQGSVLSPTLFLVHLYFNINDLVAELPWRGVKAALYALMQMIWSFGARRNVPPALRTHATSVTYRMQQALDQLAAWVERWCVSINMEKLSATLFTLSNKQKAGNLKLGDTPLTVEKEATYLGVTFDKRWKWKQQVQTAEAKARRKLATVRKLAGTSWGGQVNGSWRLCTKEQWGPV